MFAIGAARIPYDGICISIINRARRTNNPSITENVALKIRPLASKAVFTDVRIGPKRATGDNDDSVKYPMEYDIPLECISNTAEIARMANVDPKPKDHNALLPKFPCPIGYDESSYLRKLCYENLPKKMIKNNIEDLSKYYEQMTYELEVICNAGFAGYFLILWDWFEWCRANGILMGPGRGSAAGSIVSYVLNITKVDPIKNGFVFERFLNKGRLEFPDCDRLVA